MSDTRIIFAGTPEFAAPVLEALIGSGYPLAAVYTQPDRPAGRGRKLLPSPVKQVALAADVPIEQPTTLKDPAALQRLRGYAADLMIVVAYGLLLPEPVLSAFPRGCLNLHASLLPRWRGAAPIQRAILAGDTRTGVDLMQIDRGLDTGPIFARHEVDIHPRDTGRSLHDRLAELGATLLIQQLPEILAGRVLPHQQPEDGACYARKLTKDEARIDWAQSAIAIDRRIRAFNPWPIAQTHLGAETLRIWTGEPEMTAPRGDPGQILHADKTGILVATGTGGLRITELQPPGKRAMSAADFLNARQVHGASFG